MLGTSNRLQVTNYYILFIQIITVLVFFLTIHGVLPTTRDGYISIIGITMLFISEPSSCSVKGKFHDKHTLQKSTLEEFWLGQDANLYLRVTQATALRSERSSQLGIRRTQCTNDSCDNFKLIREDVQCFHCNSESFSWYREERISCVIFAANVSSKILSWLELGLSSRLVICSVSWAIGSTDHMVVESNLNARDSRFSRPLDTYPWGCGR